MCSSVTSQQLEGIGVKALLEGPIAELLAAGKTVELCVDGDTKIHNMCKGIPNLIVTHDLAHLLKNINKNMGAIVKAANFSGDKLTKMGKGNFHTL